MHFKDELKKALKELKSRGDYAYQAGVNDVLELLEEMSEFVVTDHEEAASIQKHTQDVTQRVVYLPTQQNTQEVTQETSKFDVMLDELNKIDVPEKVTLTVPDVKVDLTEEDLVKHQEKQAQEKEATERRGGVPRPRRGSAPDFDFSRNPRQQKKVAGSANSKARTETNSTQQPTQVPTQDVTQKPTQQPTQEVVEAVVEPQSPEEQAELKKAALLAERRAEQQEEADEVEEDYV